MLASSIFFSPGVNAFLTQMDDRQSMVSLAGRDGLESSGRIIEEGRRDPEGNAKRERLIEEASTLVVWAFGIKWMKSLYDHLASNVIKKVALPSMDISLLKKPELPQKATFWSLLNPPSSQHLMQKDLFHSQQFGKAAFGNAYQQLQMIVENPSLQHMHGRSDIAKFLFATATPTLAVAVGIPKLNHKLTHQKEEEKVQEKAEEIKQEEQQAEQKVQHTLAQPILEASLIQNKIPTPSIQNALAHQSPLQSQTTLQYQNRVIPRNPVGRRNMVARQNMNQNRVLNQNSFVDNGRTAKSTNRLAPTEPTTNSQLHFGHSNTSTAFPVPGMGIPAFPPLQFSHGPIPLSGVSPGVSNLLSRSVSSLLQNVRWNTLLVDFLLSGGRVYTARNKDERREIIVREGSIILFLYFAQNWIQDGIADALGHHSQMGFKALNTLYHQYKDKPANFITDYKHSFEPINALFDGQFMNQLQQLKPQQGLQYYKNLLFNKNGLLKAQQAEYRMEENLVQAIREYFIDQRHDNLIFETAKSCGWIPMIQHEGQAYLDLTQKIHVAPILQLIEHLDQSIHGELKNNPQDFSGLMKKAIHRRSFAWGLSTVICTFFLSYLIPQFQHYITLKKTGTDQFPGTEGEEGEMQAV